MKKSLYYLLLIMVYSPLAAQYFPSHDVNPEWLESYSTNGEDGEYRYYTEEEVVFCGESWTPIIRGVTGTGENYSVGYYRNDENKVYYSLGDTPDCSGKEYLMCNFSLEVGDSVYLGVPFWGLISGADTALYVVESVQTGYILDTLAKKIRLNHYSSDGLWLLDDQTWIEGVGCLDKAFPPLSCIDRDSIMYSCEVFLFLNCLKINGSPILGQSCLNEVSSNPIFVDKDSPAFYPTGASWSHAYKSLGSALDVAQYGDTIYVAEGTYKPSINRMDHRSSTFTLKNGVVVLGGFEGDETHVNQRDPHVHPTILSGDVGVEGDSTDNVYHVLYGIGLDSTTVLDGFTITKGYAKPVAFGTESYGGGLLLDTSEEYPESAPRIQNCKFINNIGIYGGAVSCKQDNNAIVSPVFRNCEFRENVAITYGGALYKNGNSYSGKGIKFQECIFDKNRSISGGTIALVSECGYHTFTDCTFTKSTAVSSGGVMYMETSCDSDSILRVNFTSCSFEDNSSNEGGVLVFYNEGEASFGFTLNTEYCTYRNNSAEGGNGGVFALYGTLNSINLFIDKSNFIDNFSTFDGGAIFIENRESLITVDIKRSVFLGNKINSYAGGAIRLRNISTINYTLLNTQATIFNSLFAFNDGAIASNSGNGVNSTLLQNCTFYNNGNYPLAKNWAEIFDYEHYYSDMTLNNCILYEPQAPLQNALYNGHPDANYLYDYHLSHCLMAVDSCDLAGGDEACGDGMIYGVDPMFLSVDSLDFRLAACSPAVNAGSNLSVSNFGLEYDILGNPRIQDDRVDIGAYERDSVEVSYTITDATNSTSQDGAISIDDFSGGQAPYQYYWNGEAGAAALTGLVSGEYELLIVDVNGCEYFYTFEVSFINDISDVSDKKAIQYFPNPLSSGNSLTITSSLAIEGKIMVYNSVGQIVIQNTVISPANQIELDLKGLQKGLYYLKLEQLGFVGKLVVE